MILSITPVVTLQTTTDKLTDCHMVVLSDQESLMDGDAYLMMINIKRPMQNWHCFNQCKANPFDDLAEKVSTRGLLKHTTLCAQKLPNDKSIRVQLFT